MLGARDHVHDRFDTDLHEGSLHRQRAVGRDEFPDRAGHVDRAGGAHRAVDGRGGREPGPVVADILHDHPAQEAVVAPALVDVGARDLRVVLRGRFRRRGPVGFLDEAGQVDRPGPADRRLPGGQRRLDDQVAAGRAADEPDLLQTGRSGRPRPHASVEHVIHPGREAEVGRQPVVGDHDAEAALREPRRQVLVLRLVAVEPAATVNVHDRGEVAGRLVDVERQVVAGLTLVDHITGDRNLGLRWRRHGTLASH